jgi:hypothetical protein
LSWGELGAAGVAADIAGATLLALAFMLKTPRQIAQEVPIWGMPLGNPILARSLVRQRAEAWFGLTFLVAGFGAQLAVYFGAMGAPTSPGRTRTSWPRSPLPSCGRLLLGGPSRVPKVMAPLVGA